MENVKKNYVDLILSGYYYLEDYYSFPKPVKEYIDELVYDNETDSLYFPDIDYASRRTARWPTAVHLYRIEKAIQSEGIERLFSDKSWRKRILGAFRYWLVKDFENPNWWYQSLNVPRSVASIALMLGDLLQEDMFDDCLKIVERAKTKLYDYRWYGVNGIWLASVVVRHALLINDKELLKKGQQSICERFVFGDVEGPRTDGAFYQHGPKIMSGGYGRSYTYESAALIKIFEGTELQISEERENILLTHILDGQQLLQFKGYFDYNVLGREYTVPDRIKLGTIVPALELLYTIKNIPRREEIGRFINEIKGVQNGLCALKWFDSSYFLAHKSENFYISVRGVGPDVFGSESVISQGVLGYNMSYGTNTCFMKTGKEYFNLAAVWDYSKLPGTTARQETDEELKQHTDWNETSQEFRPINNIKGDAAIVVQRPEHDGISLKAAFFIYKDTLIALGADITDQKNGGKVLTSVEQSHAKNTVIHSENHLENAGIHYVNLDPESKFEYETKVQNGCFKRNNAGVPETPVSFEIFTITIPVKCNGSTYAYTVCCEYPLEDIKVLKNDSECQAVLVNNAILMYIAYKNCVIEFLGKKQPVQSGECEIFDIGL